jgi:hypothetical protein
MSESKERHVNGHLRQFTFMWCKARYLFYTHCKGFLNFPSRTEALAMSTLVCWHSLKKMLRKEEDLDVATMISQKIHGGSNVQANTHISNTFQMGAMNVDLGPKAAS